MNQNIWDVADEIVNSVSNAIATDNYSGLSQKIKNTVDDATATAKEKIKEVQRTQTAYYDPEQGKYVNAGSSSNIKYNPNYQKKYVSINQREKEQNHEINTELIVCRDNQLPGRVSSHIEVGFGIAGIVLLAYPVFSTTFSFITDILAGDLTAAMAFIWFLVCGMFGLSINAVRKGKARIKKNKRFKTYKGVIGDKGYTDIIELSKEIGKSRGFVKRDLKKMIKEKYFLQGHFDKEENTFITSDNVYKEYLHTADIQQQYINENKEKQDDSISHETNVPVEKSIVEEGRTYLAKIHEANEKIEDENMTEKLNTMEDIVRRIFDRVDKEPSSSDELRRMMKYYLPTTVKLLNAYIEIGGQPSYGDNNVAKSKKEIEGTLDMINEAFGNIFDNMYEDTAWDISSDISTMKTMMKQDGLTGVNEFQ